MEARAPERSTDTNVVALRSATLAGERMGSVGEADPSARRAPASQPAIDETGRLLWSMPVLNGEAAITQLIRRVIDTGDTAVWGIDLVGSETTLQRAVLVAAGQQTD